MPESVGSIYYEVDGRTQGLLDAERQVDRSTRNMERSFGRTDRSVSSVTESLGKLSAVASAVGSALAVQQIVRYADAWTNLQNQLRQVTETENERARVTDQVLQVAKETRTSVETTANLYARLTRASSDLGLSEQRRLRITKTINQAFAVSGATAQEASAAITQLSQGLAAGALRGDEFNSVAEQAPSIMRAIADEANMTIGELREFAATGGITADLVVRALEGAADTMDERFAKAAKTFSQSMVDANNNLTEFIGTSDAVRTAVSTSGQVIVTLSENLDGVVKVAGLAATAIGVRLLQAITATIAEQAAAAIGAKTLSAAYSTMGARAATTAIAVRGLSGAMSLLGGPVGVAILAAAAIITYRDELDAMLAPTQRAKQAVSDLTDEIDRNSRAAVSNGIAKFTTELAEMEAKAKDARAEIERINDKYNVSGPMRNSMVGDDAASKARKEQFQVLQDLGVQIQARKDGIADLQDRLKSLDSASGDGAGDDDGNGGGGGGSGGDTSASDQTAAETQKIQEELARRREAVESALRTESEAALNEYQKRRDEINALYQVGTEEHKNLQEKNNADYLSRVKELNQQEKDEQTRHQEEMKKQREEAYAAQLQQITGFSEQAVQKLLEIQANAADPMAALTRNLGDAFVNLDDTIASTFVNAMSRGEGLNDILGEIGRTVLASLLQSFIKLGVQMAVNAAMGQVYQQAANQLAVQGAAQAQAAWAPAAISASIATLGAAAGIGALAYQTALAVGAGSQAASYSSGGWAESATSTGSGRANGGPVSPRSMYPVGEIGPELYTEGTRSYLLPGRNGNVTSNRDMNSGGGTPGVTVQLYGTGAENARVSQSQGPDREQIIQIMLEDSYENGPYRQSLGV